MNEATTAKPSDLLDTVTRVVEWVENLIPQAGKGSEKLAYAKMVLEALFQNLTLIWPMVSALIAALVHVYNAVGAFKTRAA